MPFQPVPGVASVELIYDQLNNSVENTLYVWKNALLDWSESDLEDLALAIADWWAVEVGPLQSAGVTLREIFVKGLAFETSPTFTLAVGDPGGASNLLLPGNVTFTVSFRTNASGRSYRGRNYWIGLYEGIVTGDTLATLSVVALVDAYAALPTYLTVASSEFAWCVVSREQDGVVLEQGELTPVTEVLAVDDTVDSQRRRLTGRGE